MARVATETKVRAASGGSALGAVWGVAALWLLDTYVIGPGVEGDVPEAVQAVVLAAAAAITAWVAGRWAKHTRRPDLPDAQR